MDEDARQDYARRLYWQCRRGMLELDILLDGFLRHGYPRSSPELQRDFARLLRLPDQTLSRYLLQGETPDDLGHARVVRRILEQRA